MRISIRKKMILLFCIVMLMSIGGTVSVHAATKTFKLASYTNNYKVTVGSRKFFYKDSTSNGKNLYLKSGKKTKKIVSNASGNFCTNGTNVVYTKELSSASAVYVKNIKTGKTRTLLKLKKSKYALILDGAHGNYAYVTATNGSDSNTLYCINLKNGKKKVIYKGLLSDFSVGSSKILIVCGEGGWGNSPVCVFNFDGTGKKTIISAFTAELRGNRIYYEKLSDDYSRIRKYSCNTNGKDVKALSKWKAAY